MAELNKLDSFSQLELELRNGDGVFRVSEEEVMTSKRAVKVLRARWTLE